MTKILITGGAGYVGSELVPALLRKGYEITVYDLFIYGYRFGSHPNLKQIEADIRDRKKLIDASADCDIMIHLACISNDPSFDLNPRLGKSINLDAFHNVLDAVECNNIKRLIFASSSSVYGINDALSVTEDAEPLPLTDYSKYKLECENLLSNSEIDVEKIILRPATLCGFAERLRLDLVINLLTMQALINHEIKIFGGKQKRAILHIKDMVRAYEHVIEASSTDVSNQIFNVGHQNISVEGIAFLIKKRLSEQNIKLTYQTTNDNRSYSIDSSKIKTALGFVPLYTITNAIDDLFVAYYTHTIRNGLHNSIYHNIEKMKQIALK